MFSSHRSAGDGAASCCNDEKCAIAMICRGSGPAGLSILDISVLDVADLLIASDAAAAWWPLVFSAALVSGHDSVPPPIGARAA